MEYNFPELGAAGEAKYGVVLDNSTGLAYHYWRCGGSCFIQCHLEPLPPVQDCCWADDGGAAAFDFILGLLYCGQKTTAH